MAQNSRTRVLVVQKLVQEEMDADAEGPQSEISHVFGKVECCERDAERQVRESRLRVSLQERQSSQQLTSTAIPGTNMTTARA